MDKFIKVDFKGLSPEEDNTVENEKSYKAIVYTNEVDREGDQADHDFLVEMAELLKDKPITKNHNWEDVDSIVGRVQDAHVIEIDGTECVEAIVNIKSKEAIEKIDSGLFKGISAGFQSEKNKGDDGVNHLTHCTDVYEISFVTVPCVPKASIKMKTFSLKGENKMEFKGFFKRKLVNQYPELKSVSDEALTALAGSNDVDITEDDIKTLMDENETLQAKVKELEQKVEGYEKAEEDAKSETLILDETEKAVDELEPTPEAKECIMDEAKECIEKGDLIVEHLPADECAEEHIAEEHVKGLSEFIERIKPRYTKLKMLGYKPEEEKPVEEVKTQEVKTLKHLNNSGIKFSTEGATVNTKTVKQNTVPSNNVTFE